MGSQVVHVVFMWLMHLVHLLAVASRCQNKPEFEDRQEERGTNLSDGACRQAEKLHMYK